MTAKAGKVTFNFDNPSQVPHAFEIEGVYGAETETVTGGKTSVTVDLKPGTYDVLLPGRRPQGGRHEGNAHGRVTRLAPDPGAPRRCGPRPAVRPA